MQASPKANGPKSAMASIVVGSQPHVSRKRVRQACDYCRAKRLKCTADIRPCLNCQLYGAECLSISHRGPKPGSKTKKTSRSRRSKVDNDSTEPDPLQQSPAVEAELAPAPTKAASIRDAGLESPEFTAAPYTDVFEQVNWGMDFGVEPSLWNFDFSQDIPDLPGEFTVAEQLLASSASGEMQSSTNNSLVKEASNTGLNDGVLDAPKVEFVSPSAQGSSPNGLFNRKGQSNTQFLGLTSTASIVASCVREAREKHSCLVDHEELHFIKDCAPMVDEIEMQDPVALPITDALSYQMTNAALLINVFLEDYHLSYSIISRSEIHNILYRYVNHGHQSLKPLERTMLYLTIAIGASSRDPNHKSIVDVKLLYDLAWRLVPYALAMPSVVSVQVLLLHVIYNIHWSKWGIAWVLCGVAARMVQTTGLQILPPERSLKSSHELRSRARLWAAAFTLDAHLSLSQGKPPALHVAECDPGLLANKDNVLHSTDLPWPLVQIVAWRVSLARIQQSLNEMLASTLCDVQRFEHLEKTAKDLRYWKDALPGDLRPESHIFLEDDAHLEVYVLHLDYLNLVQTTHWAIAEHASELPAPIVSHIRMNEAICLSASVSLVRTLNTMTDNNSKGRSFRSRADQLLTAMAIIHREVLRNPGGISTRTYLEHLRVIKLHLERMTTGHLLASSLTRLIENMVESAEQSVKQNKARC